MGIKYRYIVTGGVDTYDIELLTQEIKNTGFPLIIIHRGNGALVLEFQDVITNTDRQAIYTIILNHTPFLFKWSEVGQVKRHQVKCAEDVDKITAMRIRNLLSDNQDEPFEAQLKFLTKLISGLYIDISQATSLADFKTRAASRIAPYQNILNKRNTIIQEGQDFKTGKGW